MIHIGGPTHRLQEFLGWGRLVHLHSAVGQCPTGPSSGLTGAPWRPSLPHTALGKGARPSVEVSNAVGGARRLGASLVRWLPQPPIPALPVDVFLIRFHGTTLRLPWPAMFGPAACCHAAVSLAPCAHVFVLKLGGPEEHVITRSASPPASDHAPFFCLCVALLKRCVVL
jgi:hypothetical protein